MAAFVDPPVDLSLQLYSRQYWSGPNLNQVSIVEPGGNRTDYGRLLGIDWALIDGPGADAKVVGRMQGLNASVDSVTKFNVWFTNYSIIFHDDRFEGSTLQVRGTWNVDVSKTDRYELAIVGGTGQFTLAQGMVYLKEQTHDDGRTTELLIRVFYRPLDKPDAFKN